MVMNNTGLGLRDLLLDSGTFSHMFSEREHFISYTEANDGQLVTVSCYDLITQVATLDLRLEDELGVRGRECTID